MQIVVSDGSCLVDLRKAAMIDMAFRLPHEFLIPNALFEEGLAAFTPPQKEALIGSGLKVVDLPGEKVLRAREVVRMSTRLTVHDGFAVALAEGCPDSVLLAGDGVRRWLAAWQAVEVRGVLWVFDEIYRNRLASPEALLVALRGLSADPTVRLARRELGASIKRYEKVM